MATLDKRLEALEKVDRTDKFPRTIVLSFQMPGEAEREIHDLSDAIAGDGCRE